MGPCVFNTKYNLGVYFLSLKIILGVLTVTEGELKATTHNHVVVRFEVYSH
jgi:hypothetical protein